MVKIRVILEDAKKLEEIQSGVSAVVSATKNKDLVEGVVLGEYEDGSPSEPLFLRELIDLEEEVDIEKDLFFLLSRDIWDGAKESKIIWNKFIDELEE